MGRMAPTAPPGGGGLFNRKNAPTGPPGITGGLPTEAPFGVLDAYRESAQNRLGAPPWAQQATYVPPSANQMIANMKQQGMTSSLGGAGGPTPTGRKGASTIPPTPGGQYMYGVPPAGYYRPRGQVSGGTKVGPWADEAARGRIMKQQWTPPSNRYYANALRNMR